MWAFENLSWHMSLVVVHQLIFLTQCQIISCPFWAIFSRNLPIFCKQVLAAYSSLLEAWMHVSIWVKIWALLLITYLLFKLVQFFWPQVVLWKYRVLNSLAWRWSLYYGSISAWHVILLIILRYLDLEEVLGSDCGAWKFLVVSNLSC